MDFSVQNTEMSQSPLVPVRFQLSIEALFGWGGILFFFFCLFLFFERRALEALVTGGEVLILERFLGGADLVRLRAFEVLMKSLYASRSLDPIIRKEKATLVSAREW
ncbi:hypothetical protein P9112_010026 [Eukaryota sp. TZLM1-RC]